ncbi:hypothetical protein BJP25_25800 [Actinokineospora bangkokensis]|uniref:Uncharacterized protein n=1 Tax=Actinokineospora bangkokensis TaxID=1193682 RepID=A0A1Q9LHR5_9PSEU|nr:hypothetical protein BJP25_25800 [Actinokineospora bangkokensis]
MHTFRRFRWEMPVFACTVWMFGFHRRLVRRFECETDLPKPGPLPQTSHTAATSTLLQVAGARFPRGAGALRQPRRAQAVDTE